MSSQNVEVKLKFVVDGSGAKVIDQMTGATQKAAKAEEEYQKKLDARIKAVKEQQRLTADLQKRGVIEGPKAAPTVSDLATAAADRMRQQQAVHAELVRRGVIEGPKPPAPPPTVAEEAQKRIQAGVRQRQVREEMARLGYGPKPKLGPGRGSQAVEGLAGGFGVNGLTAFAAGPAGVGAGVAYAGQEAVSLSIQRSKIESNPWTSQAQKEEAKRRAMPLFMGRAYGVGTDIGRAYSGDLVRESQAERARILSGPEVQRASGIADISGNLGMESWFARYQAGEKMQMFHHQFDESKFSMLRGGPKHGKDQSFQLAPLRLDRPQWHDRSTLLGEKLYKEEEQLLPLRQKLTISTRRRVESETRAAVESNKAAELHQQAQRLVREYRATKKGRQALGDTDSEAAVTAQLQRYAKEDPQAQRTLTALQQARTAQEVALQSRRNAVQAGHENRQDDIEHKRAQYEVAKQREQATVAQAKSVGSMSPIEYRMAIQAFRQVKQVGIDRSTPEMIARAKQIGGETIGRLEQQRGDKRLAELQKEVGSDEYRNKSLAEARQKTDFAREQVTQARDADAQATAKGMADAVSGVLDVMLKLFRDQMDTLKSQIEGQQWHGTTQQNQ